VRRRRRQRLRRCPLLPSPLLPSPLLSLSVVAQSEGPSVAAAWGAGERAPSERRCARAGPGAEATGAPARASPTRQLGRNQPPPREDSDMSRPVKDHLVTFPVRPL